MFHQILKQGNKKDKNLSPSAQELCSSPAARNKNLSPSAQELCFSVFRRKTINLFFGVLILFLAALTVSKAIDIKDKIQVSRSTIIVSGTGTVYAKPDLALANFSVITEAETVAEALSQNAEKMNAVAGAAKQLGVEEKDLKTTSFDISPRYEWPNQNDLAGKRILAGYEVAQSLEARIRNLEKVGEIIQAATNAGANETGNLQFTVENQDEVKNQARQEAIRKTESKAKDLAAQLGVKLGRVMYFDETGSAPYYFVTGKTAGMGGESPGVPAPNVQTGESKIEITVSITYEIR